MKFPKDTENRVGLSGNLRGPTISALNTICPEPQRWSLRAIDGPGNEPLYDGMETDADGEWVRWRDVQSAVHLAMLGYLADS